MIQVILHFWAVTAFPFGFFFKDTPRGSFSFCFIFPCGIFEKIQHKNNNFEVIFTTLLLESNMAAVDYGSESGNISDYFFLPVMLNRTILCNLFIK